MADFFNSDFGIDSKILTKDGTLIIKGIASSNMFDRQGEKLTITPNALSSAITTFMYSGSPVLMEHGRSEEYGSRQIGKVIDMDYNPKDYNIDNLTPPKMKILAVCEITDLQAIKDILNGEKTCFSLKWQPLKESTYFNKSDPNQEIHFGVILKELTVCAIPVNPEAKFEIVTDPIQIKELGFEPNQSITAFGQEAKVKAFFIKENQKFLEVDFEKVKGVYIKAEDKKKEFGCVMLMYEPKQFENLINKIEKNDLYIDTEDPVKQSGVPEEFHTTLLYGLEPKVTAKEVEQKLNTPLNEIDTGVDYSGLDYSFFNLVDKTKIKAKGIKIFSNHNKPYDVVVIEMQKEPFRFANDVLKLLPYQNEYPEYIPHTTLAYVKKGMGEKYKSMDITKIDFTPIDVVYSQAEQGMEYDSLYKPKIKAETDLQVGDIVKYKVGKYAFGKGKIELISQDTNIITSDGTLEPKEGTISFLIRKYTRNKPTKLLLGKYDYELEKKEGEKQKAEFDQETQDEELLNEIYQEKTKAKKFYTNSYLKNVDKQIETKATNLDEVFKKYHETVNMSYSELKKWQENPKSKLASLSRAPINRNLKLLSKPKEKWNSFDIKNANKTIAFVNRMKNAEQGENVKVDGKDMGISKRDISLKNWAFDPKK